MKVKEMLESIQDKKLTVGEIASNYNFSTRTIQTKIKNLGFDWDSKASKYIFNGDDNSVMDMNIDIIFAKGAKINNASKKNSANKSKKVAKPISNKNADTSKSENDIIDKLLNGEKKEKKIYRGFYLEKEIMAIIDRVDEGDKSKFVNECLRKVFQEKGLL